MNPPTLDSVPTSTALFDPLQMEIMKPVAKRQRKKRKGSAHTPTVDDLYGPLVKAGLAKIVRKRGHAPRIVFLDLD